MKLGRWEISAHLTDLLGEGADTFGSVRTWSVRPGFFIYQNGELLAIAIDGLMGNYFPPDLRKITRESIARADRMGCGAGECYGDPYLVEKLFS